MPFTEMDKTVGEEKIWRKKKIKFSCGHARFKMLLRHPRRDVKRTVDSASL